MKIKSFKVWYAARMTYELETKTANLMICFKGSDGKNYFLGAANMIAWMKITFGTATNPDYHHYTQADGGTHGELFFPLFDGKQGIYALLPNDPAKATGYGATGHVDLATVSNPKLCDGDPFFIVKGGIKEISFWDLH